MNFLLRCCARCQHYCTTSWRRTPGSYRAAAHFLVSVSYHSLSCGDGGIFFGFFLNTHCHFKNPNYWIWSFKVIFVLILFNVTDKFAHLRGILHFWPPLYSQGHQVGKYFLVLILLTWCLPPPCEFHYCLSSQLPGKQRGKKKGNLTLWMMPVLISHFTRRRNAAWETYSK